MLTKLVWSFIAEEKKDKTTSATAATNTKKNNENESESDNLKDQKIMRINDN